MAPPLKVWALMRRRAKLDDKLDEEDEDEVEEDEDEDEDEDEESGMGWEETDAEGSTRSTSSGSGVSPPVATGRCLKDVLSLRNEMEVAVCTVLGDDMAGSAFTARELLNAVGWDVAAITAQLADGASKAKLAEAARVHFGPPVTLAGDAPCGVCLQPLAAAGGALPPPPLRPDLPSFDCGHRLHSDCMARFLGARVTARSGPPFRCFLGGGDCRGQVQPGVARAVLPPGDVDAFESLAFGPPPSLLSGGSLGRGFPYVPCPKCPLYVTDTGRKPALACVCGALFCPACRAVGHTPLPCRLAAEFSRLAAGAAAILAPRPSDAGGAAAARLLAASAVRPPREWEIRERVLSRKGRDPAGLTPGQRDAFGDDHREYLRAVQAEYGEMRGGLNLGLAADRARARLAALDAAAGAPGGEPLTVVEAVPSVAGAAGAKAETKGETMGDTATAPDASSVGSRITLHWAELRRWYTGTIAEYHPVEGLFSIAYDDGDRERLDLRAIPPQRKYRLLTVGRPTSAGLAAAAGGPLAPVSAILAAVDSLLAVDAADDDTPAFTVAVPTGEESVAAAETEAVSPGEADRRSVALIHSLSRFCPKCFVPIARFEGCPSVTCRACGFYFCWVCLKPQHTHGFCDAPPDPAALRTAAAALESEPDRITAAAAIAGLPDYKPASEVAERLAMRREAGGRRAALWAARRAQRLAPLAAARDELATLDGLMTAVATGPAAGVVGAAVRTCAARCDELIAQERGQREDTSPELAIQMTYLRRRYARRAERLTRAATRRLESESRRRLAAHLTAVMASGHDLRLASIQARVGAAAEKGEAPASVSAVGAPQRLLTVPGGGAGGEPAGTGSGGPETAAGAGGAASAASAATVAAALPRASLLMRAAIDHWGMAAAAAPLAEASGADLCGLVPKLTASASLCEAITCAARESGRAHHQLAALCAHAYYETVGGRLAPPVHPSIARWAAALDCRAACLDALLLRLHVLPQTLPRRMQRRAKDLAEGAASSVLVVPESAPGGTATHAITRAERLLGVPRALIRLVATSGARSRPRRPRGEGDDDDDDDGGDGGEDEDTSDDGSDVYGAGGIDGGDLESTAAAEAADAELLDEAEGSEPASYASDRSEGAGGDAEDDDDDGGDDGWGDGDDDDDDGGGSTDSDEAGPTPGPSPKVARVSPPPSPSPPHPLPPPSDPVTASLPAPGPEPPPTAMAAVGRVVRLSFPAAPDGRPHWFRGVVSAFDAATGLHLVTFADGQREWAALGNGAGTVGAVEFVAEGVAVPEAEPVAEAHAGPDPGPSSSPLVFVDGFAEPTAGEKLGEAAVGRRLRAVWGSGNGNWYYGTVSAFDAATGYHHVNYDDGDAEDLDLSRSALNLPHQRRFQYVLSKQHRPRAEPVTAVAAAAAARTPPPPPPPPPASASDDGTDPGEVLRSLFEKQLRRRAIKTVVAAAAMLTKASETARRRLLRRLRHTIVGARGGKSLRAAIEERLQE